MRERLAAERVATLRRVDALARQFGAIVESSALSTHDDEHDPEGQTVAFERAQISDLLDGARAELAELDEAVERLRAGRYGVCLDCGGPIAAERLDALPAARTCIACANRPRRRG